MVDTDHIAIVELGPNDARAGLELSTEAQWNQNEADWRFFLGRERCSAYAIPAAV
jgi:hypothetical protein